MNQVIKQLFNGVGCNRSDEIFCSIAPNTIKYYYHGNGKYYSTNIKILKTLRLPDNAASTPFVDMYTCRNLNTRFTNLDHDFVTNTEQNQLARVWFALKFFLHILVGYNFNGRNYTEQRSVQLKFVQLLSQIFQRYCKKDVHFITMLTTIFIKLFLKKFLTLSPS